MRKERVRILVKKHPIKLHPFCSPQWRSLHIISSFNDGNMKLIQFTIPSTVLERRNQESLRLQRDDTFNIRLHAGTTIHHSLPYIRNIDIIHITYATDGILATQFIHQLTMRSRKDHAARYRCTYRICSASGCRSTSQSKPCYCYISLLPFWHQNVAMQKSSLFPGIGKNHLSIFFSVLHHREMLRIFHRDSIPCIHIISSLRLTHLAGYKKISNPQEQSCLKNPMIDKYLFHH